MKSELAALSILGAVALGAVSPGPSFIMVARTAVARSRPEGLAAAAGMGCGALAFAGLAMAGVQTLMAQGPWLQAALKAMGGAYLLWLAVRIWRSAGAPLALAEATPRMGAGVGRAFVAALATQLGNPKAIIIYASVFATFLPARPDASLLIALPPLIFAIEAGWYALVALVFSQPGPRMAYAAGKTWIDRAAGAVLGLVAGRLLLEVARP